MNATKTQTTITKGDRQITLKLQGNGIHITNSTLEERIRINDNYGNGFDWTPTQTGHILHGLFLVAGVVLDEVDQNIFQL